MLISDEPEVEAICWEGLFVRAPSGVTATTGEQARIMSSRIERELDGSSTRSDYDHGKLRLLGSLPGLRLIGVDTNFYGGSVRSDYDNRKLWLLGSPPGLCLVGVDTNFRSDHGFYSM
jgi:hypothetical protein